MNKIILSAIAATILSGCSTIVSKSDYPVTIHSNPEGATFSISNEDGEIVQKGLTPSTITLDAGAGFSMVRRTLSILKKKVISIILTL